MNRKNSKKLQTLETVLAGTAVTLDYRKEPKLTIYEFKKGNVIVPARGYNEAILIARGIALATTPKENE